MQDKYLCVGTLYNINDDGGAKHDTYTIILASVLFIQCLFSIISV